MNSVSTSSLASEATDASEPVRTVSDAPATKSVRAFDKVANAIRGQIKEGRLKTGDRLANERDLAEQFSVSRSTVREALRSLENGGLLTLRRGPGGGAFVARADGGTVRNGILGRKLTAIDGVQATSVRVLSFRAKA